MSSSCRAPRVDGKAGRRHAETRTDTQGLKFHLHVTLLNPFEHLKFQRRGSLKTIFSSPSPLSPLFSCWRRRQVVPEFKSITVGALPRHPRDPAPLTRHSSRLPRSRPGPCCRPQLPAASPHTNRFPVAVLRPARWLQHRTESDMAQRLRQAAPFRRSRACNAPPTSPRPLPACPPALHPLVLHPC